MVIAERRFRPKCPTWALLPFPLRGYLWTDANSFRGTSCRFLPIPPPLVSRGRNGRFEHNRVLKHPCETAPANNHLTGVPVIQTVHKFFHRHAIDAISTVPMTAPRGGFHRRLRLPVRPKTHRSSDALSLALRPAARRGRRRGPEYASAGVGFHNAFTLLRLRVRRLIR